MIEELDQRDAVGEVSVMEEKPLVGAMLVFLQMVDSTSIHRARAADQAMHFVAFSRSNSVR